MKIIKNLRVSGLAPIGNGRGGRETTARTVVFASLGLAAVTALVGAAWAIPPSDPHMTGHESGETEFAPNAFSIWRAPSLPTLSLPTNLLSASMLLPEFSTRRFFHFPCPKRTDFPCIPSDGCMLVA